MKSCRVDTFISRVFLGLFVPLCSFVGGCGEVVHLRTRETDIMDGKWRIADWEFIRDWMVSCKHLDWNTSYICRIPLHDGGDICPSIRVCFSSSCVTSGRLAIYDIPTIVCENETPLVLNVRGVPSFCKGIALVGPLDLSNVSFSDAVECFTFVSGNSGGDAVDWNYPMSLPQLGSSSHLRWLDIEFFPTSSKAFSSLPVLDLSVLGGMKYLERIVIEVGCPVSHVPEFVASQS